MNARRIAWALCVLMALALCLPVGAGAYDLPEPREQYAPTDLNQMGSQAPLIDMRAEEYTDATLGDIMVFQAIDASKNTLRLDDIQPGESFVVTFRYENTAQVAGQPVILTPYLSASSPDEGDRRGVDKFTFRVYTQLFDKAYLDTPGNAEADYFRTSEGAAKRVRELETALPAGVPPIQRRQTELDWVSSLSRDRTVSLNTVQPGDVLYVHYWFYWDGSLNAIAPAQPGGDPIQNVNINPITGRHPNNCDFQDCTHDNHYMGLTCRLEWRLYATRQTVPPPPPSPVGYTLKYQTENGEQLKEDDIVLTAASTLKVGDTWTVQTPIADITKDSDRYEYVGYKKEESSSTPLTDTPTRTLVANEADNVLILVYRLVDDSSSSTTPTRAPSTVTTVAPVIRYQDESGRTIRPDRTLAARSVGAWFEYAFDAAVDAVDGYAFIEYRPYPPRIRLQSGGANIITLVYRVVPEQPGDDVPDDVPPLEPPSVPDGGSGEDVPDTSPPLGPPAKPDVPYTGGFDLTDLFFVGVFLLVLGLLYYRGEKKRRQSETPAP
ncbi:MAG: MucBP domain-containing protein [Oscillospiraceae bacterium]|jgi:hypothetical protein|nr:MucBP domain-containing protein [Oscillospiraceae bacterium]